MVHWIQARQAFVEERRRVRFHTVVKATRVRNGTWLQLSRIWLRPPRDEFEAYRRREHWDDYWFVPDSERLSAVLQRPDLTRRDDKPVVIVNEHRDLLAVAAGPAELGRRVVFQAVWDIERDVMAAAGANQPEWWVFEGWAADPFHGSTDAKSWVAKWKAQAEAGETPSWD